MSQETRVSPNVEQYLIDADLIELRQRLQRHDWYYDYTDDGDVWRAGHRASLEIQALRESLAARGVNTDDLYSRYCPFGK